MSREQRYFPHPRFDSYTTPEEYLRHIQSLRRAPDRSSKPARPARLPALKGTIPKGLSLIEISSGKSMFPLPFTQIKEGRKLKRSVCRADLQHAAKHLLQPEGALVAFLERKKFLLID